MCSYGKWKWNKPCALNGKTMGESKWNESLKEGLRLWYMYITDKTSKDKFKMQATRPGTFSIQAGILEKDQKN